MTLSTRGFELVDWQRDAVDAWCTGTIDGSFRGTIEVVTGGGKSLIALQCAARAARVDPDLKLAIVVPTQALARQWIRNLETHTSLTHADIGLVGAGGRGDLSSSRAVVAVLNSAADKLPEMARANQPLMLIVDECHRAGAPKFSRVLSTDAQYRLGLSATPDRDDLDDNGEPLRYDEQLVGRSLGGVVFRFDLKQARMAGWLPDYVLHHHAVSLLPDERTRYDALSRQVDEAGDEMRGLGGEFSRGRQLSRRPDALGEAARRWVSLTSQRKDLLYNAQERHRVARAIVDGLFRLDRTSDPRVILFHERVDKAIELRDDLAERLTTINVGVEHSKLNEKSRGAALAAFASGEAPILVSVKSLIEGIDVPDADTGISVASSASVRQRVQALGRVLRRSVDASGAPKKAQMHLIYVGDTVDDLIYGKTDWSDLTGADANRYWSWPGGATAPTELEGPPRSPRPTEDDAWAAVRDQAPPIDWPGEFVGQEYSVGTDGVVHNAFKGLIANPQGVGAAVARIRARSGGRFRVTPTHRLVLVWDAARQDPGPVVVARLTEPFRVADEVGAETTVEVSQLSPGSAYPGPTNRDAGSFRISQRGGGQIERTVKGGRDVADVVGDGREASNGRAVLEAWATLDRPTQKFFVNNLGHAWYEAGGSRLFLANVPGGFSWPAPEGSAS